MIISIASGKGGTGKTTVATNLARSIGANVQLMDCDVEEPNAHLFIKPSFASSETVSMPVPEVDEDKCTYCGKCAEICQFKAIAVVNENVLIFEELCHSCALAWLMAQAGVTAPIASATSVKQLLELTPAMRLRLSDDQLARLDAAGA